MINHIKIGDTITGKRINRKVTGVVVKKHPGCLVIRNIKNSEELVVIDADQVIVEKPKSNSFAK